VKAADAGLLIEGLKTAEPLYRAAEAYFQAGDKAGAVGLIEKAIAAATDEREKAFLKEQLAKYKK
jgi:hypothetical protein